MAKVIAQAHCDMFKLTGTGKMIPSNCYYVYAITEGGSVCYIGKGKKRRLFQHFKGTGNMLLGSAIRDNKENFEWFILADFQIESEALEYEEELIIECKKAAHKLYNTTHYTKEPSGQNVFKGLARLLHDYDIRIFPERFCSTLTLKEAVEIVFSLIDQQCLKTPYDKIPKYKGVRFDELGYDIYPEYGKYRVEIF